MSQVATDSSSSSQSSLMTQRVHSIGITGILIRHISLYSLVLAYSPNFNLVCSLIQDFSLFGFTSVVFITLYIVIH